MTAARVVQKIYLGLFDADGCLYNAKYVMALKALVAEHFMFFKALGDISALNEKDLESAKQHTVGIKTSIYAGAYNYFDFSDEKKQETIDRLIHVGRMQQIWDLQEMAIKDGTATPEKYTAIVEQVNQIDPKEIYMSAVNFCIDKIYELDPSVMIDLLVYYNSVLIESLVADAQKYTVMIFGVGSQRQSKEANDHNRRHNGTGCIFYDIVCFSKVIEARVPGKQIQMLTLLQTDIKHSLEFGKSFESIIKGGSEHKDHEYDETKFSIIYPMLQFVSNSFPEGEVEAFLYDDRDDIHTNLYNTFYAYKTLLTKNMLFILAQYNGELTSKRILYGTGVPDKFFAQNIRTLLAEFEKQFHVRRSQGMRDQEIEKLGVAGIVNFKDFLELRRLQTTQAQHNESLFFQRNAPVAPVHHNGHNRRNSL